MPRKHDSQPLTDGYVECDECGHPIEAHDMTGCHEVDGCPCPVTFATREVEDIRVREGLPRKWEG